MSDEDRTFSPSEAQVNRGRTQGLGVGQREMDAQRDPNRDQQATDPRRPEPFDQSLGATSGDDLGKGSSDMGAGAVSTTDRNASGADLQDRTPGGHARGASQDQGPEQTATGLDDRNAAGLDDAGDLGAGTPPGVDIHDVGQEDGPEEDWGDPADEGTMHSANHSRRGVKTEAERGQGAKTRQHNKDTFSRRV